MKKIAFIGRVLDVIRAFPDGARREAGHQLDKVQHGEAPADWKPMQSIGVGVKEIRITDTDGIYRVIYVAKFEEAVYVLHAFKKKAQKTSHQDIQKAKRAYRQILEDRKQ